MKVILSLFILLSSLQASLFDFSNSKPSKQLIEKYRSISSIGNSIAKRGQYIQYEKFKTSIDTLDVEINKLDLDKEAKSSLKNNITDYRTIIATLYTKMNTHYPEINHHYEDSLNGLLKFNQLIHSTGYAPLLDAWDRLTSTKHRYIRKPSKARAKKFHEHYREVKLVLEDLCLDEELEEPMLEYLNIYKRYFNELDSSYKSVEYSKIRRLKQLSYQVKSQLVLIIN